MKVFPEQQACSWGAVLSIGHFAVVTGFSEYSILTGEKLPKEHNFFLLIDLTNLEVANNENPLAVEWTKKGTSTV